MPKRNHVDSITAPVDRPGADSQVDDVEADACPAVEMIHDDCRDVMPVLPEGAFDGCVCDPPYGQRIAEWDHDVPEVDVWREILRLMKPGAALAAFGGRLRYDVLASRVREAGFLVKGQAVWIFRGGRAQSSNHLLPAHELIVLARAPGKPIPLDVDARAHAMGQREGPRKSQPNRFVARNRATASHLSGFDQLLRPRSIRRQRAGPLPDHCHGHRRRARGTRLRLHGAEGSQCRSPGSVKLRATCFIHSSPGSTAIPYCAEIHRC